MSDESPMLARLRAAINALKQPGDVFTNSDSASAFQKLLQEIESNNDPLNPGLEQVFIAANNAIAVQGNAINQAKLPSAKQVADLLIPVHDAWAAWLMEEYLLRLSQNMGFSGPAQEFLKVEQLVNPRLDPKPFITPPPVVPPGTPPGTPGIAPGTPPGASPGGTPLPGGAPSTGIPAVLLAAEQNLYPGSGEPDNAAVVKSSIGVNSVYMPVLAYTSSGTSVDANWVDAANNPIIVGGPLDQAVRLYQQSSLEVILALVIDCADGTGRANFHPSDPTAFIENLRGRAIELASAASRLQAAAISIAPLMFPWAGTGDAPADYMTTWRKLYNQCKTIFKGPVLYQASPNTVGPVGSRFAMDWGSGPTFIWDAIGVEIAAPTPGGIIDTATTEATWETTIDPESSFNAPLFGSSSWLRAIYNTWSNTDRKLWITTTGITGSVATVPVPVPPAPTPTPPPIPPPVTPPPVTPPPVTPPPVTPPPVTPPPVTPPPVTPPPVTPPPAPPPGPSFPHILTAGAMHTSGSQILDVNNLPQRICAVIWTGMNKRHGFLRGLDNVSFQTTMQDMTRLGFNTVKIQLNDASVLANDTVTGINTTLNPTLSGLAYMEILDQVVNYAGTIGLRVILESHSNEGTL